jgi:hypothetical protein
MNELVVALLLLYFVPSIVALSRGHTSKAGIIIANLFFGWSFVGWVITLVWASSYFDDPRKKVNLIGGRYVTDAELRQEYKQRQASRDRFWTAVGRPEQE